MEKVDNWGNIKFICSCGGDGQSDHHFVLEKKGGLIYYKCKNPNCLISFPADIHLKSIEKFNNYLEIKGNPNQFVSYFKNKGESLKVTYKKTKNSTPNYQTRYLMISRVNKR